MKRMSEEKEQEQKLPEEREKIPAPENPSKEKAKKERPCIRVNGGVLFLCAVLLVIVTVFATFFVADKLYYNGALFRESDSVSFAGENTDKYKTAKFQDILTFIENNYCLDYDINEVIEGAINGAVEALGDPYTRYLKPGELDAYVDYITGTYTGVGITYTMTESGMLVSDVTEESPAAIAGMREGDLITHINGKAVADYSDEEMTALFGTAGNEVQLSVTHSDDTAETLTITVARVSRQSVFVTDYEGLMYVRITQFDEDTGAEFLQAMEKIEAVGCRGMILDLRDNGGGYESQADIVADRILPAGVIAYSEDKNGNRLSEILSDETCINVPLAVLVNGRTASASELVTGAIRDYEKGTIIGTKTFGKALGQTRREYTEDGSGIILTVARYFTPSGECIHGTGITPDLIVELPEEYAEASIDEIPFEQDTQLQRAFELFQ